MSNLIVVTFEDQVAGKQAFASLDDLQRRGVLTLEDAALAFKDKKGKVKIKQTLENHHTGTAVVWGGFWGLLIGLLFLAPVFWGLIGALLGVIIGKSTDVGIDNKFIKEVGDSLEPGGSALLMLVTNAILDEALPELQKSGGSIYQTTLSPEDEEKLKRALEHEQIKASASEMLELE